VTRKQKSVTTVPVQKNKKAMHAIIIDDQQKRHSCSDVIGIKAPK